ncbi:VOC family protein [Streptococcus agalactiae]|uniref:VOC family protein n=2 Tax=Streptococcus agalactiae TaxID=1311 RepID=UPI00295EEF8F|nr:VOC family protein [Streptococcus agalactiae]
MYQAMKKGVNMNIQRIDHIALTVPDVEEASQFFQKAFNAKILYDGHSSNQPAVEGPIAEAIFGMPEGSSWTHRRLIQIADSIPLELFQYQATGQREASRTFDIGLQHFALQVENLPQAVRKFEEAGGTIYPAFNHITGELGAVSTVNGWVYGKTPWGTVIELVNFPT